MLLKKPEFYDIFGLGTFSFITIISLWALMTGKPFPVWTLFVLLFIGIAGLAVDGTIVYRTFIKQKKIGVDNKGSGNKGIAL